MFGLEYKEKYKNKDCYCVCHSPLSSRASCDHCHGVYLKRVREAINAFGSVKLEFPNYQPDQELLDDWEMWAHEEISHQELKKRIINRTLKRNKNDQK